MVEVDREQLGWEIVAETWERFQAQVREEWGAVDLYLNRELEDAIREFLDRDAYASLESELRAIAGQADTHRADAQTDLVSDPPDPNRPRTTVWTSIHAGLKAELAAVAAETGTPKWIVLTTAVDEYTAGGRAEELRELLSTEVAPALSDSDPQVSDPGSTEDQATRRGTAGQAVHTSDFSELSPSDIPDAHRPESWLSKADTSTAAETDNGEVYGGTTEAQVNTGLERYFSQLIDDVIARLADDDTGLPYPFSRTALYRTAAKAWIPVWDPDMKATFTDRILSRLDYEWDNKQHQYVPTIDPLIDVLTSVAPMVASVLELPLPQSLDADIDAWCELHGLDRSSDETHRIVARQATIHLLLKASLYQWYQNHGTVPPLSADSDPRAALRAAADSTHNPVFEECVLDRLVWRVDRSELDPVLTARHRLLRSAQPAEDIGRLYDELIASEHRQVLGQYRTPQNIGTLMRSWAASGDDTVLDPGIGASALSSPSHPRWENITDPSHIQGLDRSPLALLMGTTALTISRQQNTAQVTDFLEYDPENLDSDVDAVLCNPPYTRAEYLPPDYKSALNAQAEHETGLDISGHSPLYAYFCYHIRQFLSAGDRAAILTPHKYLFADYGEELKTHLLDEYNIVALVLFDPDDESIFADAHTTSLITCLEATATEHTDAATPTRCIRVTGTPSTGTLLDAIRTGETGTTDWGYINCIDQDSLSPTENWQPLFDSTTSINTSQLTPFNDLAEISRGIMTGENDFFCLSPAEVDAFEIDDQYLSKLVPGSRHIDGYDFQADDWEHWRDAGNDAWLLYIRDEIESVPTTLPDTDPDAADRSDTPQDTRHVTGTVDYLRWGIAEHDTLRTRSTLQNRSLWYRVNHRDPAPIIIPMTQRTEFRAIWNTTDARHLNTYHGVYPEDSITRREQKALLAYLNSTLADRVVQQYDRTMAGGLDKLEPGDIKQLPVLDPRNASSELVADLAAAFDELRTAARGDSDESTIIKQIDTLLADELFNDTTETPDSLREE